MTGPSGLKFAMSYKFDRTKEIVEELMKKYNKESPLLRKAFENVVTARGYELWHTDEWMRAIKDKVMNDYDALDWVYDDVVTWMRKAMIHLFPENSKFLSDFAEDVEKELLKIRVRGTRGIESLDI